MLSGAVTFEVENYVAGDFMNAMENGQEDAVGGGQWYWDSAKKVYWTWDTPALIARKFDEIVSAKSLGGVMAWSLAQDLCLFNLLYLFGMYITLMISFLVNITERDCTISFS